MQPQLPTYADVEQAAATLAGVAHRTPVLTSATADAMAGAQVFSSARTSSAWGRSSSAAATTPSPA